MNTSVEVRQVNEDRRCIEVNVESEAHDTDVLVEARNAHIRRARQVGAPTHAQMDEWVSRHLLRLAAPNQHRAPRQLRIIVRLYPWWGEVWCGMVVVVVYMREKYVCMCSGQCAVQDTVLFGVHGARRHRTAGVTHWS